MKLIYFSEANLRNSFFVKEFVSAYAEQSGKALLLHESFGSIQDTRFVTKRLSSLLSEVMVVNAAFSGDQKGLISMGNGEPNVKIPAIESLFRTVNMLILNPVSSTAGEPVLADSISLAKSLRTKLPIEETLVFSVNSKSPISQERKLIQNKSDLGKWLEIYEEESAALNNAVALAPAHLTSTRLF